MVESDSRTSEQKASKERGRTPMRLASKDKDQMPDGVASYRMLIDDEWVEARAGGRFVSVNPVTGEPLAEVPRAGAEDIDRAVLAARRALEEGSWSQTKPAGRA